ncbi:cyclic nucleotide-binding domain-containing protein [Rhizobium sp. G187]|uniref:cyclic nucleotide-binding domain-containing protein n=1 Tax=unclassified Rhizobium TaxID=2613769 RepID=UPI0006B9BAA2|nr:cyclic nucleotide-binding domain-containing protein [Rhizobium sp. AAP43]KPF42828.1 protein kinase [Rhizobium sp. AAP43]
MALSEDIELLSALPLFSSLEKDQVKLIAFGAEHRVVGPGEALFREKAPADCAYVVARGRLDLYVMGRGNQPYKQASAGPGVMLSELALVTMVERKYTAIAATETDVLRLTRAIFHRLLEEYPPMARLVQDRIKQTLGELIEGAAALGSRFD